MISILTSTYNNELYLREFLDSVLAQTYADWELILVDDGSDDSTREIVNSYTDDRIRYFYKEHTNLPDSLNFGYDLCRGEYIARADADDIMLSHRLQWQFDFMESHPNVDMQANALQIIKVKNGEWKKIGLWSNKSWYPSKEDVLKTTCLWHGSWIVRGSTWRRDKIYYDTDYFCGQDFEYMLNCVAHGWVLYNDIEVTMWRRIHDKCIVTNHKQTIMEKQKTAREKYREILVGK